MAKLHTMYAAIVMLLVGVKIQCASSTNATLFSPLINNSSSTIPTIFLHNVTYQNSTTEVGEHLLKDRATLTTTLTPISSTLQPIENNTQVSTTEKLTTTTKDPQELLIPPAEVNASIANMHNVPRKKGQIIIR